MKDFLPPLFEAQQARRQRCQCLHLSVSQGPPRLRDPDPQWATRQGRPTGREERRRGWLALQCRRLQPGPGAWLGQGCRRRGCQMLRRAGGAGRVGWGCAPGKVARWTGELWASIHRLRCQWGAFQRGGEEGKAGRQGAPSQEDREGWGWARRSGGQTSDLAGEQGGPQEGPLARRPNQSRIQGAPELGIQETMCCWTVATHFQPFACPK